MANITGTLIQGTVSIFPDKMDMNAFVNISVEGLGDVGQRTIAADDPEIVTRVQAFIESMLPYLSAKAGYPVSLPRA